MADVLPMPGPAQMRLEALFCEDAPPLGAPPDWEERRRALDVSASWIAEAPAGSGKTGLLIQRLLKLLAEGGVDRPEQVLAITFTKAATEEIRERAMRELEGAAAGTAVRGAFALETRAIAEDVLRRDAEMGWRLLDSPRRLNVRTIDSVCAEIARALPVTSGGSAGMASVEEPGALYREAGRRTLMQLGGEDPVLDAALRLLLLHRDGSLDECERLLAEMLAAREQWGELVPLGREELTEEWMEGTLRPRLDRALELAVCRGLTELSKSLPMGFVDRLTEAASAMGERMGYKGAPSPLEMCRMLRSAPEETAEHLEHWRALIHLLIAPSTESWRKRFSPNVIGFTASKEDKEQLAALIEEVQHRADVLEALCRARALPPARYPDDQWIVAKALFHVLSRALVELQIVFAERGECDFAESALLARTALRRERGVEGFESALGMELRHLLVDEMQDTSTSQYELIELLTAGWSSEGKTLFLVGDPRQSIYLFRQARVERFVATMETGLMGDLQLGRLRLRANFRSQAGLVRSFNRDFGRIFPKRHGVGEIASVPEAQAVREEATGRAGGGLAWHAAMASGTADEEARESKRRTVRRNAREVRAIAEQWRARPLPRGRTEPWRVAVLVRARRELREIVLALGAGGGRDAVPFRAVKVEPLSERREVLDLHALTRALLHPADRMAWWAVLRAPWCGLGLEDLHMLAGQDDRALFERTVMELVKERAEHLRPEGKERLERVWPVLEAAVERRSRLRLPELVERTWRSLGGDAVLGATELANGLRYLELLDEMDGAGSFELAELEDKMKGLFAAAATDTAAVELMTIHGAKGLEWDVVMVPELERKAPPARGRLLEWEELPGDDEGASRLVLAPIAGKGQDSTALNTWLRSIRASREAAERKRLFYVACTRAREELHLFGTANLMKDGSAKAESGSLLEAAWAAAEESFPAERPVIADRGVEQSMREPSADVEGLSLAAGAEETEADGPALLERMRAAFDPLERFKQTYRRTEPVAVATRPAFVRPEGSFESRSFGNAVHTFLELASERLAGGVDVAAVAAEVLTWGERARAVLRGDGLAPAVAERQAGRVVGALSRTLEEPLGQWLLGARYDARNEYALTLRAEQGGRVRFDRVFRAGALPGSTDNAEYLWIVDYKSTSHGEVGVEAFLAGERARYAGQMERYARASGAEKVRLGLWYPLLGRLVWWIAPA